VIQCPRCGRLNDVPTLSDLQSIEADGSYKIDQLQVRPEPNRMADVHRAFTREHLDEEGREIDLRPTLEDLMKVGVSAEPLDLTDAAPPPKYDPLTGERIRPIEVKHDPNEIPQQAQVPMAKPAITYAVGDEARIATAWGALSQLMQPINLFVMIVVLLFHALGLVVTSILLAGLFFMAPVLLVIMMIVLAHYGNIVDDIGRAEQNELPRPLRDASWSDDIWQPFIGVAAGLIICFWPLLLTLNLEQRWGPVFALVLAVPGLFFLPAVLITLLTSGTVLNLRPDRLLGVIAASGPVYLVAAAVFTVGVVFYLFGLGGITVNFLQLWLKNPPPMPRIMHPGITTSALLVGILLMHYFFWLVGLLYRKHHSAFPWVLQRHEKSNRKDTLAQLEQRRGQIRAMAARNAAPPSPQAPQDA
jgi:hypothetical protein